MHRCMKLSSIREIGNIYQWFKFIFADFSNRSDKMSTERSSFDFNSIIPESYKSKAEAFARCLHDKLVSLGGIRVVSSCESRDEQIGDDERKSKCFCSALVNDESLERIRLTEEELTSPDDMVTYDVPYRVLRESSSTSNLEKLFANNLYVMKQYSQSGNVLSERLNVEDTKSEPSNSDNEMKLRRCSSLKTWKTPPGTPGEKKIVRFADALGLDLADVRTFLDEIPKVPSSAYLDLNCADGYLAPPPNPTLIPKFIQPGAQIDFLERVGTDYVCLESASLTDTTVLTVSGCVRVKNFAFEKAVHVRYTNDNWTSFSDYQASYIPNSCDGFSDKFSFVLYGHTLRLGEKLEFAIRLDCCGEQYWDNNKGCNYVFECLPQSPSTSQFTDIPLSTIDTWSSFY